MPQTAKGFPMACRVWLRTVLLLTIVSLASGCTILRVDSGNEGGPIWHARGVVDGHLAVGWLDNDRLLNFQLFGGRSSGTLTEFQVWKLLRIEVGAVGLSLGLGPLSVGVGTLFYDPAIPVRLPEDDPLLEDPLDEPEPAEDAGE